MSIEMALTPSLNNEDITDIRREYEKDHTDELVASKDIGVVSERDLDYLCIVGFKSSIAKSALTEKSREDALSYLLELSFKNHEKIWESPISVRVGSWLPNVLDSNHKEITTYFVSITLIPTNYSCKRSSFKITA
jgi:hypothetical protein